MEKYDALRKYLKNNGIGEYKFTFEKIEQILGFPLPHSAYEYSAFWSNASQNSFSKSWLETGYIQERLNLTGKTVHFVRNEVVANEYLLKALQKKGNIHAEVLSKEVPSPKVSPAISVDCNELIQKADVYFDRIRNDPNARYLSWEHCYSFFQKNHISPNDETLDWLCLHLAWYLASWGMLRGGSFLLQKDYKIHLPIVKLLTSDSYKNLYGLTIKELCDETIIIKIMELSAKITALYQGNTKIDSFSSGSTPSETLITKIVLGTMGCAPAYDRYFKNGLKSCKVKQQNYNRHSLLQLAQFYYQNNHEFEAFQNQISQHRVKYPPMKIIDMCFWQLGYEIDPKKKDKQSD